MAAAERREQPAAAPPASIRDGKVPRCRWVGIVRGSWGARPSRSEARSEGSGGPCRRFPLDSSAMGDFLAARPKAVRNDAGACHRCPSSALGRQGRPTIAPLFLRSVCARGPSSLFSHRRSMKTGGRAPRPPLHSGTGCTPRPPAASDNTHCARPRHSRKNRPRWSWRFQDSMSCADAHLGGLGATGSTTR
jgi:hypothetical protein